MSDSSVFFPAEFRERAAANRRLHPWAAKTHDQIVESAAPWLRMDDEELWNLMFGPTITRSWMVWSNGHCPSCRAAVPMYDWKVDAIATPWKFACPHCAELFPKNDFLRFYRSGLDAHGLFDPTRADRSLLFNAEHPDPRDPLHPFGVDDGNGYRDGQHCWRFVGAYLIYGQWKQGVVGGIEKLAAAYTLTGESAYAHRAAILLDRVADLYPDFDWQSQGIMYDEPATAPGYVSYWCDACQEGSPLALAYDQIRGTIEGDAALVDFLARQAQRYGIAAGKRTPADIRANIETRLLRDMLANRHKVHCNFPAFHSLQLLIRTVLGWPENRESICRDIGDIVEKATSVDGVTGEKGLGGGGYAGWTLGQLARFLALYARIDDGFLPQMLARAPALRRTYRFHVDTWCLGQQYYPQAGDCGYFGARATDYAGMALAKTPGVMPSMYRFLWDLYGATSDPVYAQLLYHVNGRSANDLPCDLFERDPARLQADLDAAIQRHGATIPSASIDFRDWHLAILRAGSGPHEHALWLDYDSGGAHCHADGMNIGLFARGLDLLPDFGYPPVQFGGWASPQAIWYHKTAAHNTVVVDGKDQLGGWNAIEGGHVSLRAETQTLRLMRASSANCYAIRRYERTLAMVEISPEDFYIVDIFRVLGGRDHARFMHSLAGSLTTAGLSLQPAEPFGHDTLMRNFQADRSPGVGWSADWKVDDLYHAIEPDREVHLRHFDLTSQAIAATAEAWVVAGSINSTKEAWIPRLMVRRSANEAPLASTFVGILHPWEKRSAVASVRRLPLKASDGRAYSDSHVAIEIELADGRRDLLVSADTEDAPWAGLRQDEWQLNGPGPADTFLIRRSAAGRVERIVKCRAGGLFHVGGIEIESDHYGTMMELGFADGRASIISGTAVDTLEIRKLIIDGRNALPDISPV